MIDNNKAEEPENTDNIKPSAGEPKADDEITKEIPVNSDRGLQGSQDSAEKNGLKTEDADPSSGWVNEHDAFNDEEQADLPDLGKESSQMTPPESVDDLEFTAGWWGDVPFTPIDALNDDATQVIPHDQDFEDETRVSSIKPDVDSEAETRVIPVEQYPKQVTDDDPTIPPPNVPPDYSRQNANLPKHVSEVDQHATRVTPTAYQAVQRSAGNKAGAGSKPTPPKQKKSRQITEMSRPQKPKEKKKWQKRVLHFVLIFGFLIILTLLILGSIGIYQYFRITSSLPNIDELREKAAQFETTRILDRDGNILYEILDPNAGRRTYVPLEDISPYMIAATIATEDKDFFTNPGFDLFGMTRALWQNYTAGEIRSGASTITQQLVRALLMDPSERYEQTYERKAREIVLAYEITRQYSKEEILELYLNENFYVNMAYGVQAAAETYFKTDAESLNLSQSSFLAGLPQGPAIYDIYTNREATLYRQRSVLVLMYQLSLERDCIDVGIDRSPVCVTYEEATQAGIDLSNYDFPDLTFNMRYPHWVVYIKTLLEEQFDPQTIYRSGFTVHTTLDPDLQNEAERIVAAQVAALAGNNASNGALIAMNPRTGEILTMVGSADFHNADIDGQVNMALTQSRQPGSAIKPLTYVAAFEKGWTPSTLIWDVPTQFPPSTDPFDTGPVYEPVNYDGKFHGPVSLRSALANSYNIPAVKTLEFVGIYDNPDTPVEEGLIAFARRLGITSLNRQDYGLSLTLGGGEVSLIELTSAFGTFANQGRRLPTVAITKILDHSGNLVYEYEPPAGDQVVRVEHAYLISSILSDTNARVPMFGTNPVINLAFPAAVKTGTTNDFRDNWTMGYTPDLVVGAWVGNADYSPMMNTSGLSGAGPIWAEFMTYGINALTGGNPSPFNRPPGIVDRVVCSISGTEPSEWCPQQRSEIFAADQPPKPKSEDLWRKLMIDTWTGLAASNACDDYTDQKSAINVDDIWARKWLKDDPNGRSWAEKNGFSKPLFFVPERACRADDPRPVITLIGLVDGQTVKVDPLEIRGIMTATENFEYYRIEWGKGADPVSWKVLVDKERSPQENPDTLYEWDLEDIEAGIITLKFYLHSTEDTYAEKLITLNIQLPTPTPTDTPEATETPTLTPVPTETAVPTRTPTTAPTSTPTNSPTFTPTSTATSTPTPTHTATSTP